VALKQCFLALEAIYLTKYFIRKTIFYSIWSVKSWIKFIIITNYKYFKAAKDFQPKTVTNLDGFFALIDPKKKFWLNTTSKSYFLVNIFPEISSSYIIFCHHISMISCLKISLIVTDWCWYLCFKFNKKNVDKCPKGKKQC